MALSLDAMTPADIAAVAAIEASQHATPWHAQSFADALRCGWYARVLRDTERSGKSIVGYFVAMTTGDDEELLTITVAPENVGRGYGRLLLDTWLGDARTRGAQRLFLEVRQGNVPAIRLYESTGFTMTGMRRNYYAIPADPANGQPTGREDAILMMYQLRKAGA